MRWDHRRRAPTVQPDLAAEAYLQVAVARLVEQFDPQRIVLFGSRARGDAHPDSDIDLLVVLSTVNDHWAAVGSMLDALADRTIPVDIVVADENDLARRGNVVGSILHPALREGRVLYERR